MRWFTRLAQDMVALAWSLAFLSLIGNTLLTIYNINLLIRNEALIRDSRSRIHEIRSMLIDLLNEETGQRGYIITGDAEYLKPFADAAAGIGERIRVLQDLAADGEVRQDRVRDLQDLLQENDKRLRRVIDLRRESGQEAAREAVLTGRGKVIMDQLRAVLGDLESHENTRLDERAGIARQTYRSTVIAVLLGGGLALAMTGLAYELVRRQTALRSKAEGNLQHANLVLEDAQRNTEAAYDLLNLFVTNAPVGLALFDRELRLLRVSENLARAYGRTVEATTGAPLLTAFPHYPEAAVVDMRTVIAKGQPLLNRFNEAAPPLGSGTTRIWHSSYYPVKAGDGEVVGLGMVTQDVTERHRHEERLRESETRFRNLAEVVPQIVWVTNAQGATDYFNHRWYEFTGLTEDASLGDRWLAAVHPDDRERVASRWAQAVNSGRSFDVECRFLAVDGQSRWFLGRAVAIHQVAGQIDSWFGTWTDIDEKRRQTEVLEDVVRLRTGQLAAANAALRAEVEERRQAEDRERTAGVELRRSNAELEQFAYVASHDLQEPLRKIQAFGDRLAKKCYTEVGDQGRDFIDRMLSSAARMRRLINDLLSYSRVSTGRQSLTSVDLNDVVADVLSDLETRIGEVGGTVDVQPLPKIEADALQMRQLFQNLIGNSLKFHRPEVPPVVTISAANSPNGDPDCAAAWSITVADNGIGFDEKYSDRIFQVFQRLHGRHEFEGTGVGLAICRKIVERHGGRISVRSTPGSGAAFIVELPAVPSGDRGPDVQSDDARHHPDGR